MAEKSALVLLKEFFGYREGQGMKDFQEEIKGLSESEKHELAVLAAEKLGHTLTPPKQS